MREGVEGVLVGDRSLLLWLYVLARSMVLWCDSTTVLVLNGSVSMNDERLLKTVSNGVESRCHRLSQRASQNCLDDFMSSSIT